MTTRTAPTMIAHTADVETMTDAELLAFFGLDDILAEYGGMEGYYEWLNGEVAVAA